MPLILGTNSIKDTGYNVANSLRFNQGSSDYLNRTNGSSTGKIWSFSCWFKISDPSDTNMNIFNVSSDANNTTYVEVATKSQNGLDIQVRNGSGTTYIRRRSSAVLRDVTSWYNAIVIFDSTNSTADDRIKVFLNGSRLTSFQENVGTVDADYVTQIGVSNAAVEIGRNTSAAHHFDGYLAEIVLVDGTALSTTDFGEFDEDSPTIWKPKDVSGLTFGTNGFHLDFENSSALGNDVSGNDNDFTVNNLTAADQTTDTCTNNFATLNPLGFAGTIPTFSQGNLNVVCGSGVSLWSVPTIGVSSGKWYVEGRLEGSTIASGVYYHDIGFADRPDNAGQSLYSSDARVFWLSSWDGKINYRTGGSTTAGLVTGLTTIVPGNFFQLYLDMDNELMYWGREGSLLNSTGVSFNGKESLTGEYYFAFADQYTNGTTEYAVNFGQGSFVGSNYGTTSVSNFQDANGFGNFKYNPTVTTDEGSKDFLALCTKNLAESG